jgi:hypothetical protein
MKVHSVVKVQLHTFTTSALHESSKHGYFPAEGTSPQKVGLPSKSVWTLWKRDESLACA